MKNTTPALYKLIKTTNHNMIIRQDGTRKVAVLIGKNYQLLTHNQIENRGLCIKISDKMLATQYIAGTFNMAVEAAKALIKEAS